MKFISHIIVKGKIKVSKDIVHFYENSGIAKTPYTDIPLNCQSIENIRNDLKNYEHIDQIQIENDTISQETKELMTKVKSININSFLLQSYIDYRECDPIEDLICIVVEQGKIMPETLDDDGYNYVHNYGYDDYKILYYNYYDAESKYIKLLKGQ